MDAITVKRNLTQELGSVIKAAVSERSDGEALPSDATQAVCNVIESIFIHGLRDPFFVKGSRYAKYPEPNFWPFISKFSHRSIRSQISGLKQIRSEVGRARAWVRIVLNEGVIEHYVTALSRDNKAVRQFYHHSAYLRDPEQVDIMISYLKGLSRAKINAPVNSSFLNSWTPTPLILAGLIRGEASKMSARKRTGSSGIVVEMEDIPEDDIPMGVSALEYEGLENDSFPPPSPSAYAKSPLCLPGRHTPKGAFSEDEDASSVYSHPSMMDGKFQEAMRYPRARAGSQTSTSTPNPTTDEREGFSDSGIASDMGQVVVHRHSRSATRSSPSGSFSSQPPPPSITVSDFGCQTATDSGAQTDVCDLTLSTAVGTSNDDIIDDVSDDQHVFLNAQTTLNQDDDGVEEDGERSQLIAPPTPFGELDDTFVTAREKLDSVDQSPADSPVGKDNTETLNDSAPEENMGAAESIPIKFTRSLELNDGEPKSLGDELMIAALNDSIFNQSGNSLFGKGWGSREVIEEDRIRFSSLNATTDDPADTTSDSTPENFDAVLRNALSYRLGLVDSPAPETKVRNRLDSGRFADTVNDRSETPIEVGRASIDENADEAALAAARTVLPPDAGVSNRRLTSINLDEYVVIDSSQVSGMDECGISSDRLPLLTRIAPEEGLDLQNYQCPSCRRSIGLIYGPWKTCSFDGKYYCPDCQRKDEMIVPARMIHSWDLSLKPVSRPSKSFVDHVADRPLIRLDQVNPTLYEAIPEMATVHMLREKLSLVAMYLLTCKESVADDLRRRVWPKEYLYNDIHLFSVNDLINASTGVLEKHLLSVIAYAVKHVEQCRLCVQKGFICEICTHKQIIYPFQVETTFRCTKCFSVYHQGCIKNRPCPKCLRKEQYMKERKNNATDQLFNNLMMDDD